MTYRTRRNWCLYFGMTFFALSQSLVEAQVPKLIRYQGHLKDAQGVPLEGPYTLTFRLYAAATGGTPLWTEDQPNVPVTEGSFGVLLGSVTALDAMAWNQPCWLSIQVNGQTELTPRQQITSVPLAIRAETAEIVKTSGLTDDDNRLVPTGAVILWTGASCPVGYTRASSMDGRFLVSAGTFNATAGGSNSHSHTTPSHSHTISGSTSQASGPSHGWNASRGTGTEPTDAAELRHTHSISGSTSNDGGSSTGTVDSRPEFATILLCQKD